MFRARFCSSTLCRVCSGESHRVGPAQITLCPERLWNAALQESSGGNVWLTFSAMQWHQWHVFDSIDHRLPHAAMSVLCSWGQEVSPHVLHCLEAQAVHGLCILLVSLAWRGTCHSCIGQCGIHASLENYKQPALCSIHCQWSDMWSSWGTWSWLAVCCEGKWAASILWMDRPFNLVNNLSVAPLAAFLCDNTFHFSVNILWIYCSYKVLKTNIRDHSKWLVVSDYHLCN